jgi:hypothetical protein
MYKTPASRAFYKINNGDLSSNPIQERMVEYANQLYETKKLPLNDWIVVEDKSSRILIHKQFNSIQDRMAKLSPDIKLPWNSKKALCALKKYIPYKQKARKKHLRLFKKAYNTLSETEKNKLGVLIGDIPLNRNTIPTSLICIPYYADNKSLWQKSGLKHNHINRIPPYAKIHESGVIFASQACRNKQIRRHDYFSYAAEEVQNGKADNIENKLIQTAKHEGSHGPLDEIIPIALRISDTCTIPEGIAGSLGNDGRDQKHTAISIYELINNPCNSNNGRTSYELNYICAPKLFSSIVKELIRSKKAKNVQQAWQMIFTQSLRTVTNITDNKKFKRLNENSKTSVFYKEFINKLDIEIDNLEKQYEKLNS